MWVLGDPEPSTISRSVVVVDSGGIGGVMIVEGAVGRLLWVSMLVAEFRFE